MYDEVVGEKEIAGMLAVKENTVHQWRARGSLPEPDGFVSGNPAWHWSTIQKWAEATGRTPSVREHILTVLASSPRGGNFVTPITGALVRLGVVGPRTNPARVATVLTDLMTEGLVSTHLRNEWRITADGRSAVKAFSEDGRDLPRIRRLYEECRRPVLNRTAGYYTERRYRLALVRYARALIALEELSSADKEQLLAAREAVDLAEARNWSPRMVNAVDHAYELLQAVLDEVEKNTSLTTYSNPIARTRTA
ncbi:MAG TPA: hypothetical protein VH661_09700 [Candidatus Dormibacteraeota bacterium]|jgi:hypothetical protein|nr:hypothetical protein [Candidatus Dormibacteraeota bacterium]